MSESPYTTPEGSGCRVVIPGSLRVPEAIVIAEPEPETT